MTGEEGRTSIGVPRGLTHWIDQVLEKLGDPNLADRKALARVAGQRIIERYSLRTRKIPPRGHGRRDRIDVSPAQRAIIRDAARAEKIPFMSPDEAYRNEMIEILKTLEAKGDRRGRVA
jgi:hypothetical protein